MGRGKNLSLAGANYGTLRVTSKGSQPRWWQIECEDCGRKFEALGYRLITGSVKCQCQRKGRHLHARRGNHPLEYDRWQYMKARCKRDKNYKGIVEYDPRWESFAVFLADMGTCPEGYSLDRKNPFDDYKKENCRWAPPDVQAANKRRAKLLRYDWVCEGDTGTRYGGAVGTPAEWAWYLRRMTRNKFWTTQRLLDLLQVFSLEQILRTASPWGLPPEELAFAAGTDFSEMWKDYISGVYLQTA